MGIMLAANTQTAMRTNGLTGLGGGPFVSPDRIIGECRFQQNFALSLSPTGNGCCRGSDGQSPLESHPHAGWAAVVGQSFS